MSEKWIYQPVFKGGSTRPWERFTIWLQDPPNYDNSYGINTGSHKHALANVRALGSKTKTEYVANLMSLAPELLDACEAALEVLLTDEGSATEQLRSVVAKARKTNNPTLGVTKDAY